MQPHQSAGRWDTPSHDENSSSKMAAMVYRSLGRQAHPHQLGQWWCSVPVFPWERIGGG